MTSRPPAVAGKTWTFAVVDVLVKLTSVVTRNHLLHIFLTWPSQLHLHIVGCFIYMCMVSAFFELIYSFRPDTTSVNCTDTCSVNSTARSCQIFNFMISCFASDVADGDEAFSEDLYKHCLCYAQCLSHPFHIFASRTLKM